MLELSVPFNDLPQTNAHTHTLSKLCLAELPLILSLCLLPVSLLLSCLSRSSSDKHWKLWSRSPKYSSERTWCTEFSIRFLKTFSLWFFQRFSGYFVLVAHLRTDDQEHLITWLLGSFVWWLGCCELLAHRDPGSIAWVVIIPFPFSLASWIIILLLKWFISWSCRCFCRLFSVFPHSSYNIQQVVVNSEEIKG